MTWVWGGRDRGTLRANTLATACPTDRLGRRSQALPHRLLSAVADAEQLLERSSREMELRAGDKKPERVLSRKNAGSSSNVHALTMSAKTKTSSWRDIGSRARHRAHARHGEQQAREASGAARGAGRQARDTAGDARAPGHQARDTAGAARGAGRQARDTAGDARGPGRQARGHWGSFRQPGHHARDTTGIAREPGRPPRDAPDAFKATSGVLPGSAGLALE
jgi:hypothetical protein